MKKFKKVLSASAFLLLMVLIGNFLRFILIDDSQSFTRIMMHELYTAEENIDVLYLGSSHCYRSLIPQVTDEIFQANTFNGGTSLQQLDATYALLVEAAKSNDLQQVYVELYYGVNGEVFADRTDMTATYLVADYMKPSLNKFLLLTNAGSAKHYVNSFLPARRNWEKLFTPKYIIDTIRHKFSPTYRNYDYLTINGDAYLAKGFMANDMKYSGSGDYILGGDIPNSFYDNYISDDCREYVLKIIEFCSEKDIKLTFFAAPMTDFSLISLGNYDAYIKQVKELLNEYNVEYYDFNLCKNEYLALTNDDYIDPQHLNTTGATKFSKLFGDFFTGKLSEEIFHKSHAEKIDSFPGKVFGLNITRIESYNSDDLYPELYFDHENYQYWNAQPISDDLCVMRYHIEKESPAGEVTLFQDWSDTAFFFAPTGESGTFLIKATNQLNGKTTDVIRFPY